jgi:hypothetical protein
MLSAALHDQRYEYAYIERHRGTKLAAYSITHATLPCHVPEALRSIVWLLSSAIVEFPREISRHVFHTQNSIAMLSKSFDAHLE